jgi:hypothetical protein
VQVSAKTQLVLFKCAFRNIFNLLHSPRFGVEILSRHVLMRPTTLFERDAVIAARRFCEEQGKSLYLDKVIRLWQHHFDAFVNGYPTNGQLKRGTILYKPGSIRMPLGRKALVYESREHSAGLPPRGIATIDYVVACRLDEVNEDEWGRDGFVSQEDLLWQMTGMPGRYYQDLAPDSLVSCYSFADYDPAPSRQEVNSLLCIVALHSSAADF